MNGLSKLSINKVLSKGTIPPKKLSIIACVFFTIAWSVVLMGAVCAPTLDLRIMVPILGTIVFGSLDGGAIYCIVLGKKLRRYVALCLQDAVKVQAYAKLYGKQQGATLFTSLKRIKVTFKIGGKKYAKYSPDRKVGGILPGFNQYADQHIWIWYSLKQDEVLFSSKDWKV